MFSWLGQGDGDTLTPGPANPANAVHIGVGGTGDVVVDHVGELLDIQAPGGDGCGSELAAWFTPQMLHPKPGKPRPPLTMAQLPAECRGVLGAP